MMIQPQPVLDCYLTSCVLISVIGCSRVLQVWKYGDDSKTVLSHPGYDVSRPRTREDLVSQHMNYQ